MSNVHGLYSGKKKNDDEKDDNDDDHNNRYVGGIGDHGGGSGLAVQPNHDDAAAAAAAAAGGSGAGQRDTVFGLAENATAESSSSVRRTITMYRDGFVVDDGPYRRLDDPANAEFLKALAKGMTPRELLEDGGEGGGDVMVGLVDKRSEEYVETFRSFSGQGTSLGTSTAAAGADGAAASDDLFDPATLPETPPPAVDGQPTTSVAVRLPSGQRRVIRINLSATVTDLATHLRSEAASDGSSFRLVAGYPPKPLADKTATIEAAGLKGAQVSMQKA